MLIIKYKQIIEENMIQQIKLDELINPSQVINEEDYEAYETLDEASFECADIAEEICALESNIAVYEAAKTVKKNKSAKKNLKLVKTKMKAKDAKALKATKGKKVLKITKEDEDTGGTGPLPTTSDTNGLTDTDLDAAPEEVVQVIESGDPVEDNTSVGTEGVDFITEYEDASIMTYEANEKATKKAFWDKLKEFVKAIGRWIATAIAKIISVFKNSANYYKTQDKQLEEGLKSGKEINVYPYSKNPEVLVKAALEDCKKVIDSANKAIDSGKVDGGIIGLFNGTGALAKAADASSDAIFANIVNGTDDAKKIVAKAENGKVQNIELSTFKYFAIDFDKSMKSIQSEWKKIEQKVNSASKDDWKLQSVRLAVSAANKAVTKTFSSCSRIASNVNNIMFQLGGTKLPKE
jgi:hypothetical protein